MLQKADDFHYTTIFKMNSGCVPCWIVEIWNFCHSAIMGPLLLLQFACSYKISWKSCDALADIARIVIDFLYVLVAAVIF